MVKRFAWLSCLAVAVGCQEKPVPIRLAPPSTPEPVVERRTTRTLSPTRTGPPLVVKDVAPETIGGTGETTMGDSTLAAVFQQQQGLDLRSLNLPSSFDTDLESSEGNPVLDAKNLAEQGKLPEAVNTLREAIRREPQNAPAYELLGMIFNVQGEYNKAILNFDIAINLTPKKAPLYLQRGAARLRLNQHDAAIGDLSQAIELGMKTPEVYLNRGIARLNSRKFNEAIADADRSIELNPQHPDGYFVRSLAKLFSNRGVEARKDYDKAVAQGLDPQAKTMGDRFFAQVVTPK